MSTETNTAPEVKPAPSLVAFRGNVYRADHKHAPFTDKDGVRHDDYHDGLFAIVYSKEHVPLLAAAPDLHAETDRSGRFAQFVECQVVGIAGMDPNDSRIPAMLQGLLTAAKDRKAAARAAISKATAKETAAHV